MPQVFTTIGGSEGAIKLGTLLKAYRLRSGLNLKDLAAQAAISVSFVGMIEGGNRGPSRQVVEAMLSLMEDQDLIRWSEDGEVLYLTDPTTKREELGFTFAHGARGRKNPAFEESEKEKIPTVLVRNEYIRLECLKAACKDFDLNEDEILYRAKRFETFVKGQ